jgi:hypothetical protein
MKPDVMEQTKVIEQDRQKMLAASKKTIPTIMVNEPGKEPRPLSPEETLQLMQKQQQDIQMLTARNKELEEMVVELQNQILRKATKTVMTPPTEEESLAVPLDQKPKSEPDILVDL